MNRKINKFETEYDNLAGKIDIETDYLKNYYRAQKPRYLTNFSVIDKYFNTKDNILDIGISPGYFTYCLSRLGYKLKALDLKPERIDSLISDEVEIKKCDVEKDRIPFQDKCFDGIIFAALLEHLRINPIFSLREINRVLKPSGRLILETPNMLWWKSRLRVLLGRSYDVTPYFAFNLLEKEGHAGHIRVYTMLEVIEIIEKTGFVVEDYFWLNSGQLVRRVPVKNNIFSSFRNQLYVVARKI